MIAILKRGLLYLFALLLLVFTAYPFVYMISTALKSQQEFYEAPYALFSSFNFENVKTVFLNGINSILYK